MRLHVGCGLVHRPGWINADRFVADAADVRADAVLLPFPGSSAEAVDAHHLIEHLGYVGAIYALHEWARVLAPGGSLLIETPDRPITLGAAADVETGAAVLPWVFGTEQRGQRHRYLFAVEDLVQLATQAGFQEIAVEHILTRQERPTLRLTARRGSDSPGASFTQHLRRALIASGVVSPQHAPRHLAALETVCARACELVEAPGREALARLVGLSARYSPRVTACILEALPGRQAWPSEALDKARRLASDLVREQFTARLACRWRTLPKAPGVADAAWVRLEREISLYLAARLCPGEGLDAARDELEAATATLAPLDRSIDLFCREALTDLARRATAQGVRAWCRDDLARSELAFQAALGYDPGLLWARWNLARFYVHLGRRLDALAQYEALHASLPTGLRPAFEREMDAVTRRDASLPAPSGPLPDMADLLRDAA